MIMTENIPGYTSGADEKVGPKGNQGRIQLMQVSSRAKELTSFFKNRHWRALRRNNFHTYLPRSVEGSLKGVWVRTASETCKEAFAAI